MECRMLLPPLDFVERQCSSVESEEGQGPGWPAELGSAFLDVERVELRDARFMEGQSDLMFKQAGSRKYEVMSSYLKQCNVTGKAKMDGPRAEDHRAHASTQDLDE